MDNRCKRNNVSYIFMAWIVKPREKFCIQILFCQHLNTFFFGCGFLVKHSKDRLRVLIRATYIRLVKSSRNEVSRECTVVYFVS